MSNRTISSYSQVYQRNSGKPILGFTLIEILVVMVILGITITFAMLSFGDFGGKRRVILATEQFVNFVKLVQQQAVLETGTLGIKVADNSYQALRFDPDAGWQYFPENSIFRRREFPSSVQLQFQPRISSGQNPQIVINESAEMNRFQLNIILKTEEVAHVVGHHSGLIKMESEPRPSGSVHEE